MTHAQFNDLIKRIDALTREVQTLEKRAISGNEAISNGVSSHTVTFSPPLPSGSTPGFLGLTLATPMGSSPIAVVLEEGTLSTTGFIVNFGSPIPNANFKLLWRLNY